MTPEGRSSHSPPNAAFGPREKRLNRVSPVEAVFYWCWKGTAVWSYNNACFYFLNIFNMLLWGHLSYAAPSPPHPGIKFQLLNKRLKSKSSYLREICMPMLM